MKTIIQKNKLVIIGGIMGAIGGFLYWKYVGCTTGTCLIQSNPYRMTLYGALMGGLLFNIFQKESNKI